MRTVQSVLQFLVLSVTYSSVTARDLPSFPLGHFPPQSKDEPWNPQLMLETVQTYVTWGSSEGTVMPDCSRFDDIFFLNKTWMSPFAVPNGYVIFYIEKSCKELEENLTWHSGSLEAGHYVYPFYYGQDTRPYRVAFVWTAVGSSNYRQIFGLKNYDFTIISTFQLFNETAVILGKDIFWPESKEEVPETITTMIQQYMSLMDGDCKKFPELFWEDYGSISPSGSSDGFFGTKGLTAYCEKMMYEWSSYVYHLHHVTYSVSIYNDEINEVAFTWTRTGLHMGEVRTDEVLTEFSLQVDDTPFKAVKISTAYDFFQPNEEKARQK